MPLVETRMLDIGVHGMLIPGATPSVQTPHEPDHTILLDWPSDQVEVWDWLRTEAGVQIEDWDVFARTRDGEPVVLSVWIRDKAMAMAFWERFGGYSLEA